MASSEWCALTGRRQAGSNPGNPPELGYFRIGGDTPGTDSLPVLQSDVETRKTMTSLTATVAPLVEFFVADSPWR